MDKTLQQFVLLDALLENWDGIRVRMGDLAPRLEAALVGVAAHLAAARQPEQVAQAIDRLLDLTEDTPAYDYVRQLLQRCEWPASATTRGVIGEQASADTAVAGLLQAAGQMAAAAGASTAFKTIPVFFATNRKVDAQVSFDKRFSGDYANTVTYGFAPVTIPTHQHRLGRVERPLPLIGREQTDRHVVLGSGDTFERNAFATQLAAAVAVAPCKELLVFLHGYRVTFEEAARRAAQLAHDTLFGGVVVLFSWPSAGTLMAYPADEACAAKSAEPLRNFLRDLEGGPWDRVHLLAHSMGNRVMVASLSGQEQGWSLPIQNVMMVAADVDVDLFEQQFPALHQRVSGQAGALVTSYASGSDRALALSAWLNRTTRMGRVGDKPLTLTGLESIDATAADTSLLSLHHGYFAQERSMLTDLGLLVRERLPASRRGLAPVAGKWWTFAR